MKSIPLILAPTALVIVACTSIDMPDQDEGAALFTTNCAVCHGMDGKGGLPLAKDAPDLTQISARNGGTFPQAAVLSQIDGYGRGSAQDLMPEFGDLLEGETVPVDIDGTSTPTPRPLAALLAYLESIQTP